MSGFERPDDCSATRFEWGAAACRDDSLAYLDAMGGVTQ